MRRGIGLLVLLMVLPALARSEGRLPPKEYYRVITERNLFRKLGWAPPEPQPRFRLVMTVIAEGSSSQEDETSRMEALFWGGLLGEEPPPTPDESGPPARPDRALIASTQGSATYYVQVGDRIEDLTVTKIERHRVVLTNAAGEETILQMEEPRLIGGGGGGPRGGPPSRRGPRPGPRGERPPSGRRFDFPAGARRFFQNLPPEARRELREKLRNASPEERQEILRSFRPREEQ